MTAALAIIAGIIALFIIGACRVASDADEAAEQIARQLAQGDAAPVPKVDVPHHDGDFAR